ncbi:MAG: aminotransferase class I/II-fold pyridoxal phosphate-dependent enzyme [Bacilli bacterium]
MNELFKRLHLHKEKQLHSFHVPGHKNGALFQSEVLRSISYFDTTELSITDDLHAPEREIKRLQEKIAQIYDSEASFCLVNGSTSGNLAAICSQFYPGDVVMVQRNSHKSIFHALKLAGVRMVIVDVWSDLETNIPVGITYEQFVQRVTPDVKGLVLTYPNYFGQGRTDIEETIRYAKNLGITVIVDEAHGAHFCVSRLFPKSTLQMGADLVIQSVHKTLPALTMAAVLHVGKKAKINKDRLQYYLSVFQSSSPSFLILLSIEESMRFIEVLQENEQKTLHFIEKMRTTLLHNTLKSPHQNRDLLHIDPLKVLVYNDRIADGKELQRVFEEKDIYLELSYGKYNLFILPLSSCEDEERLQEKIKDVEITLSHYPQIQTEEKHYEFEMIKSEVPLSFRELESYTPKCISISESIGSIAAENVTPYPPGIPFIVEGEILKKEHIEVLNMMMQNQCNLHCNEHVYEGKIMIYQKKGRP